MAAENAVASPSALTTALRKARWRLIPLLSICYLAAYVDRANISFAAESMNRDLGFSPHVYGLGAGLFFLSYAFCEIPSNRLLLRFGARRWLARIMFTWGLFSMAMMLVRTAPQFYGLRLLLGVAEAGYFPGVIYFLSLWFPAAQRARAISLFYIAFPLSSTVMGVVAGAFLGINGRWGLSGWQWLFLLEGAPAVLLSLVVWSFLPNGPAEARWLNEDERAALLQQNHEQGHGSSPHDLGRVMRESRVWILGLFYFCVLGLQYAVSFFLPAMLRLLTGWTPDRVGFLIAGCGLAMAAAMVLTACHSDRSAERLWHIAIPVAVMALLMMGAGLHLRGFFGIVALLGTLVSYAALQGPMLAMVTSLCPGENAALAVAAFNMCGLFGAFVGPYCMGWMRELTRGYAVGIGMMTLPCAVALGCLLWLHRLGAFANPHQLPAEPPFPVAATAGRLS